MPWDEGLVNSLVYDRPDPAEGRVISCVRAIHDALDLALGHDPSVFVLGQGVDDPSAMFGTTRGLQVKFGAARVFDTPLSEVIREMAKVEGAVVGAGTVLNPDDLKAALDAGAQFIVSPGLTEPLGRAAIDSGVLSCPAPPMPATSCADLDMGLTHFKFFPATTNGGIPALKSLAAPLTRRASARPAALPK